ncbi:MAG: glutaredoxin family protein [Deltaproteobacteria bacterium]|nr:MAG: glutaredoxin family protein [Deltaproteobacteria bacterium]
MRRYRATSPPKPVILYTWSDCSDDQCQRMRKFLEEKQIDYIEKRLKDDPEVQEEMKRLAGTRRLIHPVLIVPGARPIKGYNRIRLEETFR